MGAPFIRVEATKFTEVGIYGTDTSSIVEDLLNAAMKLELERARNAVAEAAQTAAERRIVDALVEGGATESHAELLQRLLNLDYDNELAMRRIDVKVDENAAKGPSGLFSGSSGVGMEMPAGGIGVGPARSH